MSLLQDAVKPGKDGGEADGSSSEADDEGIDAENSNMRHYSNGSDEFEIDRPCATLKPPRRSGKPYVNKAAEGAFTDHCVVLFHGNVFRAVCPCMLSQFPDRIEKKSLCFSAIISGAS